MKILKYAALLVALLSMPVSAGTTVAKISQILLFDGGNLVYIYPVGGVREAPGCHGSNGDYISFSMDRPMAKEYLSLLMMAFASDKTVVFSTKDGCFDQSNSVTLNYFIVQS